MMDELEQGPDALAQLHLRLFGKSWLKQRRLREVIEMAIPLDGQTGLDLVSDEAFSYHLRERTALEGCKWNSAARTERQEELLRSLVGERVTRVEGAELPFADGTFDVIVVTDFLEYVEADERFVAECHRVLRSSGRLIVSVPRHKRWSFIRSVRRWTGLVEGRRGPVREGYTESRLFEVLKDGFDVQESKTYSRFFVELTDTFCKLMTGYAGLSDEIDDERYRLRLRRAVRFYSIMFPVFFLAAALDCLLFFAGGYNLMARAKRRMWVPRRTPRLRDGRSIAEAALQSKIGTATDF